MSPMLSMIPPTPNALTSLPSELISRIFLVLSWVSPSGISACRLVNHSFNEHSSPFLLPCVIFSRQLGPLTKLRQVLCHPYFKQHVTQLVYDASEYSEATALDWHRYVEDCARAPRDLKFTEWTDQKRLDEMAWEGLDTLANLNRPGHEGTSPSERALDDGNERAVDLGVQFSDAFLFGCHETFGRYVQSNVDQQRIRKDKIDLYILAAALVHFPKLRSIVLTDYRGLARHGESYDICCRRLFGRTLEPQHAGIGGQTTPSGDCLFSLLHILAGVPTAHVESLAIGPHAFEYTGEDIDELADPNHPANPQYLDISAFEDVQLEPGDRALTVLGQLRHLRLALCYSGCRSDEEHMREQLRKFLKSSAPQLQTLTLHMIYLFWGGVREVPKVDNDARFEVFHSVVSPMRLPFLRSLSLRRWIFSVDELRPFLLEHSSTLRDLHLLGCLCGDNESDLARWGGENLRLDGVELSGFLSAVGVQSANVHGWTQVDTAQWRDMESAMSEWGIANLEKLWLAGRPNVVERQQRVEIVPEPEWWKQATDV